MADIQTVTADMQELLNIQAQQDAKLDEIAAYIAGLQANVPVTQAQLDALAGLVSQAKSGAAANLAETDALDEPTTP